MSTVIASDSADPFADRFVFALALAVVVVGALEHVVGALEVLGVLHAVRVDLDGEHRQQHD